MRQVDAFADVAEQTAELEALFALFEGLDDGGVGARLAESVKRVDPMVARTLVTQLAFIIERAEIVATELA